MAEVSSWKNIGTNRMSDSRHYSGIKSEPTQAEWETIFDAHEGRINPGCVSERCLSLADAPMAKIMREGIFWDEARDPPEDDPYAIREFIHHLHTRAGVSGGAAAGAFLNRINTWCIDGFKEIQDSLDDIAFTDELSNYLPAPVIQALDRHSLSPILKGGTAENTELTVLDLGRWQLTRIGKRAVVDEQDLVNDAPGSIRRSIAQMGRAAKRSWLDLAYWMILSNPKIEQDDIELFHVDHGNFGSAVLSDSAIGAACAAIRRQVIEASEGPNVQQIQHINIQPRYLTITPELETAARKALRLMKLDDPDLDLKLRIESRLTNLGVRNPLDGTAIKGTPTCWMVSASKDVAPWLLQGILAGGAQPRIRAGELNPGHSTGQYGLGVDISWAVACKLADYRGVYFSTGTGA